MRLTKTVGQFLIGPGTTRELGRLLAERVRSPDDRVVYLIDHYFRDQELVSRLPLKVSDTIDFIDTTHEPTTDQVDGIADELKNAPPPVAVVGIGGGSVLDIAKAVSNLLTNTGRAADYQGWDLVGTPGIFKVGMPTISGTGAEASRTCVLMNYQKNLKLGMNSEFSVYDRLILDPDLSVSVPRNQYFYTAMDTYIHCLESLAGQFRNSLADAYSRQALALCQQVFLSDDMQSDANRESMMVASFLGGSAIGNSYVGLVHPFSAGLSMVFHTHHCIGNCIALSALEEFYPRELCEFQRMADKQKVNIPRGLGKKLTNQELSDLYQATIIHEKPLINALGENFKNILTFDKVCSIFEKM